MQQNIDKLIKKEIVTELEQGVTVLVKLNKKNIFRIKL